MNKTIRIRTNSFRIRNYENELATVFPIGMGEFYTVAWDNDAPDTAIYTKQQVDGAFENGKWERIEADASEESRSFRYYHKDSPETIGRFYRESDTEGIVYYEDDTDPCTNWGPKEAENFINIGYWIVVGEDFVAPIADEYAIGCGNVPSEPKKTTLHISSSIPETMDVKGYESLTWTPIGEITFEVHGKDSKAFKDAEQALIDYMKPDVLQTIKSFTEKHPAQVSILNGYYKVYDCEFDVEYTANSDEELLKILDSLLVLIEAAR